MFYRQADIKYNKVRVSRLFMGPCQLEAPSEAGALRLPLWGPPKYNWPHFSLPRPALFVAVSVS